MESLRLNKCEQGIPRYIRCDVNKDISIQEFLFKNCGRTAITVVAITFTCWPQKF